MILERTAATVAICEGARVGPRLFASLLLRFGSPEGILDVLPSELSSVASLSPKRAAAIAACRERLATVEERLLQYEMHDIKTLTFFDEAYPSALRALPDPPPYLYLRGTLPSAQPAVAVTGSAHPSAEGIADAVAIGKHLAALRSAPVTMLCGPIDGAVHLGALSRKGHGIGVVASGLDRIRPEEMLTIAGQVAESGGILSEHPPAWKATRSRIEAASRVVTGLASALVVVEPEPGCVRTGALARAARRGAKPVLLVRADARTAEQWLSEGAYPVADPSHLDGLLDYA